MFVRSCLVALLPLAALAFAACSSDGDVAPEGSPEEPPPGGGPGDPSPTDQPDGRADGSDEECVPLADPICETSDGTCTYVSNKPGSGAGTFDDPYGMADLPSATTDHCALSSAAFEPLRPGDIVYFRGGQYDLTTCPGGYYAKGYLRPDVSGEPGKPITFKAYPGETVVLRTVSGGQPALGDDGRDHVSYIGFTLEEDAGIRVSGKGVEIGYCEIVGRFLDQSDNHDGIRVEDASDGRIHHNVVRGVKGQGCNNAGIKVYRGKNMVFEDNYIFDNTCGVYDKESGLDNVYRRNFFTGNTDSEFYGNNQANPARFEIYENVFDGEINLHYLTRGSKIHDNLVRASSLTGAWAGEAYDVHVWNNVVLSEDAPTAFYDHRARFDGGPEKHFGYFDHNVYVAEPRYLFDTYSDAPQRLTLADIRAKGFELQARIAPPSAIYVDQTTYELQDAFKTAGRYGDPVGPDDVASILDLDRYGPKAIPCAPTK